MKRDGSQDVAFRPGQEWQLGKTAASIAFVRAASWHIAHTPKEPQRKRLERFVEQLKSGDRSLLEYMTVDSFLRDPSVCGVKFLPGFKSS